MTDSLEVENLKTRIEELEKNHIRFMEDLAADLPPCTVDEMNIKLRVKELLNSDERLRIVEREKEKIQENADQKISVLVNEIKKLRDEIEVQNKQNSMLLSRLDILEEKAKHVQAQNLIVQTFGKIIQHTNRPKNRLGRWLLKLKGLYV